MSISSLVLGLWQFSFIRYWPEIQKSEIPLSEFCPIFGDWGKLGIPNLAWMCLIKRYWMMQNARATVFTVSKLLRENQQGKGVKLPTAPTQIRVKVTNTVKPPRMFSLAYNLPKTMSSFSPSKLRRLK